ncbi:MAG TPA: hypothetical protein VEL74_02440 [Thermoanaerobaculia bacterium]|nr:hypothetical protein [Thermoanaerobaculia bacterium]
MSPRPLGERPERGDRPAFAAAHRSSVLLSSIVRPIAGREPFYQLGTERWRDGYPLLRNGSPQG